MLAGDRAAADHRRGRHRRRPSTCLSSPRARPLVYDVRSRGRDVRDLNGHGTRVADAHRARGPGCAADDHPRRQLERRLQRRQRSHGDSLRGRPRRADHQPQSRRCRHVDRPSARPSGTRSPAARSSSPQPATTTRAAPSIRRRCSARTGSPVAAVLRDGAHAPFSNTGPWVSIAALGEEGTSFAAPVVAAAAAGSGLRTRGSQRARSSRSCRRPRPATACARTSSASASSTSRPRSRAHACCGFARRRRARSSRRARGAARRCARSPCRSGAPHRSSTAPAR